MSGGQGVSVSETSKDNLSAVYDKYSDMLFRLALAQLASKEDAMDAVHDVFLKYFDTRMKFNDSEHERAWFIRSTVNRCHDICRHKKIRSHPSLDEISDVIADDSVSEELLQLRRGLSAIPEKYRIAVTLHYLEGFSVEEISTMLKISVSGVKMRLSRGRDALKLYIKEEDNNV
jgi:RNA polymerase sigma-70 factor (ECF subfamily)